MYYGQFKQSLNSSDVLSSIRSFGHLIEMHRDGSVTIDRKSSEFESLEEARKYIKSKTFSEKLEVQISQEIYEEISEIRIANIESLQESMNQNLLHFRMKTGNILDAYTVWEMNEKQVLNYSPTSLAKASYKNRFEIPNQVRPLENKKHEILDEFYEIAKKVEEITKDTVFVAHNVNFDYNIIQAEFKSLGFNFKRKKLCTVRLGRKVFPELHSYSLGNLCRALKIPIDNRHRAGGDAAATVLLFEKYLQNDGQLHIDAMLKKSSAEQWLPLHLTKADIQQLPNKPGVYYFNNEKNKIVSRWPYPKRN